MQGCDVVDIFQERGRPAGGVLDIGSAAGSGIFPVAAPFDLYNFVTRAEIVLGKRHLFRCIGRAGSGSTGEEGDRPDLSNLRLSVPVRKCKVLCVVSIIGSAVQDDGIYTGHIALRVLKPTGVHRTRVPVRGILNRAKLQVTSRLSFQVNSD